jgi:hypothetical protein
MLARVHASEPSASAVLRLISPGVRRGLVANRHPLIHDPHLHQHDRPSHSSSDGKHSPSATPMPPNRTHRHPKAGPTVAQLPDPRPRSVTHVAKPQCQR